MLNRNKNHEDKEHVISQHKTPRNKNHKDTQNKNNNQDHILTENLSFKFNIVLGKNALIFISSVFSRDL